MAAPLLHAATVIEHGRNGSAVSVVKMYGSHGADSAGPSAGLIRSGHDWVW